jgi:hypothetical protein|nr:MAG TPA: Exonuclease [Caudoviricetes sp.]
MKILNVSQAQDTEAWLDARIGKITGTKAGTLALEHYAQKDVAKLEAMADKAKTEEKAEEYREKARQAKRDNERLKVNLDFWQFLADMIAEQPDGEPPMERGHRLENTNIMMACDKFDISPDVVEFDTGMWVSSTDDRIAVSPDAHAKPQIDINGLEHNPTFAFEAKSLGTKYHLQTVVPFRVYQMLNYSETPDSQRNELQSLSLKLFPEILETRREFDFIPEQYQSQVLQYFVVNPDLQTVYFTMLDDRVYGSLQHEVFAVERQSVASEIEAQETKELQTLALIDGLQKLGGVEW